MISPRVKSRVSLLFRIGTNGDKTRVYVKHRVKRGETVYSIARKYDVSVSSIRSYNRLGSKKKLVQGRRLTIPVARERKLCG